MQIEMKVKVTPEEFYEYMTYIIARQVENLFGEKVDPSQIKRGYTHKTMVANTSKSNKMRYTITKAIKPRLFETLYSTGVSQTTVRYEIKEDPKGSVLTYTSTTKVFNGPQAKEGGIHSISDFYNKQKMKMSIKKSIRQIKRARG